VRRTRILVVEDEPDVRDLIVEILEAERYEVHAAVNRQEAKAELAQHAYDLLVIDLRSSVLFVTRPTRAKDGEGFLTKPPRLTVPKPFAPPALCWAVRRALTTPEQPSTR
jgi:response regulator receiver domain-containing protein